jgi:hypothetical protein
MKEIKINNASENDFAYYPNFYPPLTHFPANGKEENEETTMVKEAEKEGEEMEVHDEFKKQIHPTHFHHQYSPYFHRTPMHMKKIVKHEMKKGKMTLPQHHYYRYAPNFYTHPYFTQHLKHKGGDKADVVPEVVADNGDPKERKRRNVVYATGAYQPYPTYYPNMVYPMFSSSAAYHPSAATVTKTKLILPPSDQAFLPTKAGEDVDIDNDATPDDRRLEREQDEVVVADVVQSSSDSETDHEDETVANEVIDEAKQAVISGTGDMSSEETEDSEESSEEDSSEEAEGTENEAQVEQKVESPLRVPLFVRPALQYPMLTRPVYNPALLNTRLYPQYIPTFSYYPTYSPTFYHNTPTPTLNKDQKASALPASYISTFGLNTGAQKLAALVE